MCPPDEYKSSIHFLLALFFALYQLLSLLAAKCSTTVRSLVTNFVCLPFGAEQVAQSGFLELF